MIEEGEVHVWWVTPAGKDQARGASRMILARYTGRHPACIELERGLHGKPYLIQSSSAPDIRFNVSHSGDYLCCALTLGSEVGVDLELLRPVPEAEAIAAMLLTPVEQEEARASGWCADAFLRCWVRKEALLKGIGVGIAASREGEPGAGWSIHDLAAPAGYIAAIAVEHPECPRTRHFSWPARTTGYNAPIMKRNTRQECHHL